MFGDLPLCVAQESNIGFWLRRRQICKYFRAMQSIVVDHRWCLMPLFAIRESTSELRNAADLC